MSGLSSPASIADSSTSSESALVVRIPAHILPQTSTLDLNRGRAGRIASGRGQRGGQRPQSSPIEPILVDSLPVHSPRPPQVVRTNIASGALVTARMGTIDTSLRGRASRMLVQGRVLNVSPRGRNRMAEVQWNGLQNSSSSHHIRTLSLIDEPEEIEDVEESESESDSEQVVLVAPETTEESSEEGILVNGEMWMMRESILHDSRYARQPHRFRTVIVMPSGSERKPLDYMKRMWPFEFFPIWISATNIKLSEKALACPTPKQRKNYRPLNSNEFLCFLGCLLFMTHYNLPRNEFWAEANGAYPSLNLRERIGISRNRFSAILTNLSFLIPIEGRRENPYEQLDALLRHFHATRAKIAIDLGHELCIDELFSSWLGESEGSITKNPHKPKGIGQELICLSDTESGIMVALELCKGRTNNAILSEGLQYGPAVTLRLAKLAKITGSSRRICGDSRFASVSTARVAKQHGFEFTGCVKIAVRNFPKKFLQTIDHYAARGDTRVLETADNILAFGWCDCSLTHPDSKRIKTFVSTCGTTLEGEPHLKTRKKIVDGVPQQYTFNVPRCQTVDEYYKSSGSVDRHNLLRQGVLSLEQVWGTQQWTNRVIATLFGIFQTDSYLAFRFEKKCDTTFREFNQLLFADIQAHYKIAEETTEASSSDACWLNSIRKVSHPRQKPCTSSSCELDGRGRTKKTGNYCFPCSSPEKLVSLCDPRSGRTCFADHVADARSKRGRHE